MVGVGMNGKARSAGVPGGKNAVRCARFGAIPPGVVREMVVAAATWDGAPVVPAAEMAIIVVGPGLPWPPGPDVRELLAVWLRAVLGRRQERALAATWDWLWRRCERELAAGARGGRWVSLDEAVHLVRRARTRASRQLADEARPPEHWSHERPAGDRLGRRAGGAAA
jgi:hypothetical protein